MRNLRPWIMLLLALVSGGLAGYLALQYLRQQASPLMAAEPRSGQVALATRDLDRLIGMVPVKTIWAASVTGEAIDLRVLAEPALIVPESMPALEVRERFRDRASNAAMVVDEYGGIQGLVTLHDLLEAITGDLEVSQRQSGEVVRRADGSWLLDGALPVHEVRDVLEMDDPLPGEEEGDYETLGGFLMFRLERIPDVGDTTDWEGRRFEVVDMDGRRVDRVLVTTDPEGMPAVVDGSD